MYDNNFYDALESEREGQRQRRAAIYLARVMGWMSVGLLTTLAAALASLASPQFMYALFTSNMVYGVMIAQIVVVIAMSAAARRVSPGLATVMFMVYSALTGVTFSSLALIFELSSIIYVFGVTALLFVGLSAYGFVTKRDLTRIGTLALFALVGLILAGLVNMFIGNGLIDFIITFVGILVFLALIAYDSQRIKDIYLSAVDSGADDEDPELRKVAIYGALSLYLDFINLFLKLLMLLGRRRS